jgi:hypothetical protein
MVGTTITIAISSCLIGILIGLVIGKRISDKVVKKVLDEKELEFINLLNQRREQTLQEVEKNPNNFMYDWIREKSGK